jgi:periplasmic protein TonB
MQAVQPFGEQQFQPGAKRGGAIVAAIVIHMGLLYLLASGLGALPKFTAEPETVMISVPADPTETKPEQPLARVDPKLSEPEVPVIPEPDIVVENVPQQTAVQAVTTDTAQPVSEVVDEKIRVLQNYEPPYPPGALRREEEGTVYVRITVTPQGRVTDASIERSSGFNELDQTALKAIRNWRFAAAKRGGQSVATSAVVPVVFKIRDRR